MSEAKRTKAPWSLGPQNGHCGVTIIGGDKRVVATVYLNVISSKWEWGKETFEQPENAEAMANARLIAEAPRLLDALIKARHFVLTSSEPVCTELEEIDAAIAAAQGEDA